MEAFYKADRVIKKLVRRGERKFVIFPFGDRGMMVKSILNNRYGIQEEYIVDNGLVEINCNESIISLDKIKNIDMSDKLVLLCSDNEIIYSRIRNQLLQYVGIDRVVDVLSPSMFFDDKVYYDAPYSDHPRICALEAAAREIYRNNVPGAIAECGVWQGHFADKMSRYMPDRKLYLFDTFSGFDEKDIDEQEEKFSSSFRNRVSFDGTSVELALNNIGWRANAIVRKGYFPETAAGLEDERFAFVSLDTDLYKPILAGLEFFYPRMNPGGYIFVDDLGHKELLGVREAVIEFCERENIGYTSVFDGLDATAIIVKPLGSGK